MRIDNTGRTCEKCGNGMYEELYLTDDWDGVLHCSSCNYRIDRYMLKNRESNLQVEWQSYLYGPMKNGTIISDEGDFCMILDEDGQRHYISKQFVSISNGD
jgi:hypothetical protein